MSLQRLVLWRHGQTAWNAVRRFQGHTDVPLDERGILQAQQAAPLLAEYRPSVIVASDLVRARATAQVLADQVGLPVRVDPRLRENHYGRWEGLTLSEITADWPDQWRRWLAVDPDFAPPGGSPRRATAVAAAAVVAELCTELAGVAGAVGAASAGRFAGAAVPAGTAGVSAMTAVVVAHGGTVLALTAHLLGLPDAHWRVLSGIANCHWVDLRPSDLGWRVHAYNVGTISADTARRRH